MHTHSSRKSASIKKDPLKAFTALTTALWCLCANPSLAGTSATSHDSVRLTLNEALDTVSIEPRPETDCIGQRAHQDKPYCAGRQAPSMDLLTLRYFTAPSEFINTQVLDQPGIQLPSGYATFGLFGHRMYITNDIDH